METKPIIVSKKIENEEFKEKQYSKNSLTAKSGFNAEKIFRSDNKIKIVLELYFNLKYN